MGRLYFARWKYLVPEKLKSNDVVLVGSKHNRICTIHPDYRRLLQAIRFSRYQAVALDLPRSMWNRALTRDEWMAKNILKVLKENRGGKVLVIVGNLHTLKKVNWLDGSNDHDFILGCLAKGKPGIRVCSILTEHTEEKEDESDFKGKFGPGQTPVALEAAGLKVRLGVLKILKCCRMSPEELTDGILIF